MSRLPETEYNAQYPYNQTTVTRSGHEFHVDDTPGHERIRNAHKSGTYFEVSADGKKVELIVGDEYHYVKGGLTLTIDNNSDILVSGNLRLVVQGDVSAEVHGNMSSMVGGDSINIVNGNNYSKVNGKTTIDSDTVSIKAAQTKVDGDLSVTGQIKSDTDVMAGNVSLKNHKHKGVQSGLSITDTPI